MFIVSETEAIFQTMIRFTVSLLIPIIFASGFDFEIRNGTTNEMTNGTTNGMTNETTNGTTNGMTNETTTDNHTKILTDDVPSFLVKLSAVLNDSKVPPYLTNLILNQPSESNITMDDILTLYGLKTINITGTKKMLTNLNISSSEVFSAKGFEGFLTELQLDFKTVYTNVVNNLQVEPVDQLTFLGSLGIDPILFSFALQFADPYTEFKKGNLSTESFINAIQGINRTSEEVYNNLRNQFVNEILKKSPEENFSVLKKYGVENNKFGNLWNILNVSSRTPHQILVFDQLLHNVTSEIDKHSPLAILTSKDQVTTNKEALRYFEGKPVSVTGFILGNNTELRILNIQNSSKPNIMILTLENVINYSDNTSYASVAMTSEQLRNCTLVSINSNNTIVNETVIYIENHREILKLNLTHSFSNISMGSPLICSNKVYGLVKDIFSGIVTLDSFWRDIPSTTPKPDNNKPDGNKPDGNKPDGNKPVNNIEHPPSGAYLCRSSLLVLVFCFSRYLVL